MRICIIGAGAAGLSSARHANDEKFGNQCIVFEQNSEIGGTWVYSDKTGLNEYGNLVHTSMYKKLMTNLPKEIMGFPDFQFTDYYNSYLNQEQVLAFLNSYVSHFNLRSIIQFNHRVKHIEPQENTWKVTVTNLKYKKDIVHEFDAVMICNGHYSTPNYPKITGSDIFTGKQIHSHDYRDENDFNNQKVLLIGAGASSFDIATQITRTAKKVYLSHHKDVFKTLIPDNIEQKPDVSSMTKDEIIFKDDSKINIDTIIYCTGYSYSFPFLNEKCGITVYKHVINVNNPTMSFIGLPFYVCCFPMFDLQARYFLEYLRGTFELPPKDEILKEINDNLSELFAKGLSKKHAHLMGDKQENYYSSLASQAKIKSLSPVMIKIYNDCITRIFTDVNNFRKTVFRIVDENNYVILES